MIITLILSCTILPWLCWALIESQKSGDNMLRANNSTDRRSYRPMISLDQPVPCTNQITWSACTMDQSAVCMQLELKFSNLVLTLHWVAINMIMHLEIGINENWKWAWTYLVKLGPDVAQSGCLDGWMKSCVTCYDHHWSVVCGQQWVESWVTTATNILCNK